MSWWDLIPFLIAGAFAAPIIAVGNLARPQAPGQDTRLVIKFVLVIIILTVVCLLMPLWLALAVTVAVISAFTAGVALLARKVRRS